MDESYVVRAGTLPEWGRLAGLRGPLLAFAAVVVLELLRATPFAIEFPGGILILVVAYAAFSGGVAPGIASGVIGLAWFAALLVEPGTLMGYTAADLQRIAVIGLAMPAVALLMGVLKQRTISLARRRIEELERTEVLLRDSESRFRNLFTSAPIPMWVYDAESLAFLDVNRAAVVQYGWSREEWLKMRATDLRPIGALAFAESARLRNPDAISSGAWRHLRADGSAIDVEVTAERVHYGGRPAVVMTARDVSALRRAQDALSRLAAIVDATEDAIYTKDVHGRITSWNAAAARLYGWSFDEMRGEPVTRLVPARRAGEELRILRQVLAGKAVERFETERQRKNGEVVRVALSASPLKDERDVVVGVSVIARALPAKPA